MRPQIQFEIIIKFFLLFLWFSIEAKLEKRNILCNRANHLFYLCSWGFFLPHAFDHNEHIVSRNIDLQ